MVARWVDTVARGDGGILAVRGEAGIGKSSVVGHLARSAGAAGIAVAQGTGEDGSGLPYQALTEWLELLVQRPPAGCRSDDVDLVRARLAATLGSRRDLDSVRASQQALHDAMARILRARLARGPVAVVVDDAHWLDEASSALLAHLGTVLTSRSDGQGAALGLVLSLRPSTRLGSVGRLVHGPGTEVLDLGPLSASAVGRLIEARWGWRVPAAVSVQVREASGGNPLGVIAVVEAGLQHGALDVVGGSLAIEHAAGLMPADIDSTVNDAIDALPPTCREVAAHAAVLGDRPELADLHALVARGQGHGDVDAAIDALVDAGLLVDRGASLGFSHPRVRAAVLHRLGPRRRARLHAAVSELYLDSPGDRGLLAAGHHLELAGVVVDPRRMAEAAERAGDVCTARFAWTEAVRFFGAALRARRASDEVDPWLLHRLAMAERLADDPEPCIVHAREAVAAYREHGDLEAWGEAEVLATREALACRPPSQVGSAFDVSHLREWLAASEGELDGLRARALALLADVHMAASEHEQGAAAIAEARRLAESVDDQAVLATIGVCCGLDALGRLDLEGAERNLRSAGSHARRADDDLQLCHATSRLALTHLVSGRPDRAQVELDRSRSTFQSVDHQAESSLAAAVEASAAVARGQVSEAELRATESLERGAASGYGYSTLLAFPALFAARALSGDLAGAQDARQRWERDRAASQSRWRWLIEVTAGGPDGVEEVRRAVRDRTSLRGRTPARSLFGMWVVAAQAEVALTLDREDLAGDVREDLRWLDERGVLLVPSWPLFLPRLRAGVEALVGGPVAGAPAFARAARVADAHGLEVESLRIVIDRHRRDLDDGDDGLAAAARRLAEMGLTALVPPHLREPEVASGVRIVAFCDLVASTQLNVAVGDRRYAELIAELTDTLRTVLPAHGGVEFKHTGDGLAVWFTSVVAAIRWTQQVTRTLRALTEAHPSEALLLRFGIAAGEPVDRSGDLFGLAVALAARLCSEAEPGEALVAEEVRLLAASQGISFRPAGRFRLKGFSEDVVAHVVVDAPWSAPSREA